MENNVILTNMLAKGLNMDVGVLRNLVNQAVLPEKYYNTCCRFHDNSRNQEMPMTLGQAGTVFKSQFTVMIGKFGEATRSIN